MAAAILTVSVPEYLTNASLCQGFPLAFFAGCEVPFGRCVLARESWPGAFLVADCGRRLAAPPGRSSSLRCGRSPWTRGFAGGRMAAIAEWPPLLPGAGLPAGVVVGWPGPG